MDFIKGILIFFVFLIFVKIGSIYSKKYINRASQLEQMKNLLNIFKVKIKFTCNTIQEIFNQLYEDTPNEIGEIFKKANEYMETYSAKEAWNTSLEEAKTDLTKEDIETLKNLGKILGETDVEGQINQIELTETLLKNQIKELAKEGIDINLDPPCVSLFTQAYNESIIIKQRSKTEIAGHVAKGKW